MITFGEVRLSAAHDMKIAATRTASGRTLSVIFEHVQCRDGGDSKSRFSAKSLDIDVDLQGAGEGRCVVDVRGSEDQTSDQAFAVLRLQAGGQRMAFVADPLTGVLQPRLELPLSAPGTVRISALLLCNAGSALDEVLLTLDSIDMTLGEA